MGKGRVRHTPRGKFRPRSLEKWIRNQRIPPKVPAISGSGNPPSRAAHRTHRCRSPAPPSPGAERPAAVACPRGSATGRAGSGQPAAEDAEQAEPSACSPASAATRRESRATLLGRGGGEVEGGPVPPARQPARLVHLQVPTGARPPPARLGSARQRASGPWRRSDEAWLGTWCPWGSQLRETT